MPRYLSSHTLACLTRQGAEELIKSLWKPGACRPLRALVNLTEGKMLVEFEAADREAAAAWLHSMSFHWDWLLRLELESAGEGFSRF